MKTLRFRRGANTLTIAYCVKCRAQREMTNARNTTFKNGKKALTGVCGVCSTKLFRIGG